MHKFFQIAALRQLKKKAPIVLFGRLLCWEGLTSRFGHAQKSSILFGDIMVPYIE